MTGLEFLGCMLVLLFLSLWTCVDALPGGPDDDGPQALPPGDP